MGTLIFLVNGQIIINLVLLLSKVKFLKLYQVTFDINCSMLIH
jgi:hypothetical protein